MGKQRITKKQKETIFIYRALSVRIFAFIMLLGGIVGLLFFFRPEVSDVEKRTLTKFPTPTVSSLWDGQFFYDLSLWYSDTYPMRDGLIAVDQKIENAYGITSSTMMVGSRQISDDIPDIEEEKTDDSSEQPQEVEQISAPDSRAMESEIQKQIQQNLYVKDGAAYSLYYYSQAAADTYTAALNKAAAELEGKTNVYSILVPNNSGVMLSEEELEALGGADQQQAIRYYYSLTDGVKTVDTIDTLREHNDEYLYFRTDHHWTQLGAYYAYVEFCNVRGFEPVPLDQFDRKDYTGYLGTFYSNTESSALANNPDTVEAYIPDIDLELDEESWIEQLEWFAQIW